MSAINPLRGEAEARIGDMSVKMAATMDGLARLSEATGRPSLQELYQRLLGGELATVRDAIRLFTVGGTDSAGKPLKAPAAIAAALLRLSLSDAIGLQVTFSDMLSALLRKDEPAEAESPNG